MFRWNHEKEVAPVYELFLFARNSENGVLSYGLAVKNPTKTLDYKNWLFDYIVKFELEESRRKACSLGSFLNRQKTRQLNKKQKLIKFRTKTMNTRKTDMMNAGTKAINKTKTEIINARTQQ